MKKHPEPKKELTPCYKCLLFPVCKSNLIKSMESTAVAISSDASKLERVPYDIADYVIALNNLKLKCSILKDYLTNFSTYENNLECLQKTFNITFKEWFYEKELYPTM